MKYLKMLALASLAAFALVACLGSAGASATVLCKENKNPCGSDYAAGTEFKGQLPAGVSMLWRKFGEVSDTCTGATMVGKTSNTGGAKTAVSIPLSALTWTGCTTARETLKPGTLELEYLTESIYSAKVTLKGAEWKEGPCVYGSPGSTWIGSLKKSPTLTSHAEIEVKVVYTRISGFPCAETVEWEARYTITAPVPLYVSES